MDPASATDAARQALTLVVIIASPVLVTGLIVALIVSIGQAVTQVQEHTLSFVPKIIAMMIALVVFGPWMIAKAVEFGMEMFSQLP